MIAFLGLDGYVYVYNRSDTAVDESSDEIFHFVFEWLRSVASDSP